jgi:hypothetical protein
VKRIFGFRSRKAVRRAADAHVHLLQVAACSKYSLQLGEALTEFVFATILCKAEMCSSSRPLKTEERKCLFERFLRASIASKITRTEHDLHTFYIFPLHKARRT